ncbi:MAG: universal stress protein [Cellvibrionaceae bacterium]
MGYNTIIIGLDLSDESDTVLEQALSLRNDSSAHISLIHVLEPLTFAYGGDIPMDLSEVQNQMVAQGEIKLKQIAADKQLDNVDSQVIIGQPATELHRIAKENDAELIVVGSHGRHGLALLLGSTANSVLHGAECDMLAVRV